MQSPINSRLMNLTLLELLQNLLTTSSDINRITLWRVAKWEKKNFLRLSRIAPDTNWLLSTLVKRTTKKLKWSRHRDTWKTFSITEVHWKLRSLKNIFVLETRSVHLLAWSIGWHANKLYRLTMSTVHEPLRFRNLFINCSQRQTGEQDIKIVSSFIFHIEILADDQVEWKSSRPTRQRPNENNYFHA